MMEILSFCAAVRRGTRVLLEPRIFVPLALVLFVAFSAARLSHNARDPKGRADLVSGDAMHYLDIAGDFAAGNFSMDYVQRRPHRQPLYPLALAPVLHFVGKNDFWLGAVNIVFGAAGFLVLYAGVLHFQRSPLVAAFTGLLYLQDGFLTASVTRHFLTEALHMLLLLGIIFAALAYLREGKLWQIVVAAAVTGLDYLTRPNGLFIACSLLATVAARDAFLALRERNLRRALKPLPGFALAVVVFLIVATPSWLPRLRDYGKPFYHGYLSNYLWVDTYKEGHVGQKFAKYHWQDYVKTHTAWDAAGRALSGVWNVGFAIPFNAGGRWHAVFLLSLAGVALALARGPAEYRWLFVFGVIQLLPLIWTNLSNPTMRVPYASTLPFSLVFAALFLGRIGERVRRHWGPRPQDTPSSPEDARSDFKEAPRFIFS
jgi:hypothetical protein